MRNLFPKRVIKQLIIDKDYKRYFGYSHQVSIRFLGIVEVSRVPCILCGQIPQTGGMYDYLFRFGGSHESVRLCRDNEACELIQAVSDRRFT